MLFPMYRQSYLGLPLQLLVYDPCVLLTRALMSFYIAHSAAQIFIVICPNWKTCSRFIDCTSCTFVFKKIQASFVMRYLAFFIAVLNPRKLLAF